MICKGDGKGDWDDDSEDEGLRAGIILTLPLPSTEPYPLSTPLRGGMQEVQSSPSTPLRGGRTDSSQGRQGSEEDRISPPAPHRSGGLGS